MTLATEGTILVITPLSGAEGFKLTPYSARNLTQTLEPISGTSGGGNALGSWIRESTNGVLINLTYAALPQAAINHNLYRYRDALLE